MGCGNVNWIRLTQDKNPWRPLLKALMNLWVMSQKGTVFEQLGDYKLLEKSSMKLMLSARASDTCCGLKYL
jgi:hypothetical protein